MIKNVEPSHGEYLIDIVDENGAVVGQKSRKDVNKAQDLYHGVYAIVVTPDKKLVLNIIPHRKDLPNLYAGKLGATVATIRRHGETAHDAVIRALAKEIHLFEPRARYLGTDFAVLSDGRRSYMSAFAVVSEVPAEYSARDIGGPVTMTMDELAKRLAEDPAAFAPTLALIWEKRRGWLPV